MDNLKISALLCSRLCHDLASPIGAIGNGVEMLEMESDPAMVAQITDLIAQSARQTSNRLQFYRLAFGAAGGFGAEIAFTEAKEAMAAFFADQKIEVEFAPGDRTGSPALVKLLMNLALSVGETIIRGGKLSILIEVKDDGSHYIFVAEAEKIVVRDNVPDALKGCLAADDLDPKSIPAALAAEIAGQFGAKIEILEQSAGRFILAVTVAAGGQD